MFKHSGIEPDDCCHAVFTVILSKKHLKKNGNVGRTYCNGQEHITIGGWCGNVDIFGDWNKLIAKIWRCTYLGRNNNGSLKKPLINRISKIHSGLSTSCSRRLMVHFTINPICITGARQRAFNVCIPRIASAEIGTKITMVYMRTNRLQQIFEELQT